MRNNCALAGSGWRLGETGVVIEAVDPGVCDFLKSI